MMPERDCGLVYTSYESVGLGMDILPNESPSFCSVWGWLVRLFYVCYICTRIAYYVIFARNEGAALTETVLLDVNFLLAVAINYRLSSGGHVLRRVLVRFPSDASGNPVAFFANAMVPVVLLVWGVAIFVSISLHANTAERPALESAFVVLSHYVNGIFVFGTFTFSATLFIYVMYCLCFELHKYQMNLANVFKSVPKPSVLNLVLRDFCYIWNVASPVTVLLRDILFLWFASATLYMLDMATLWVLSRGGPQVATAAVLTAVLVALLFFNSDLATRLRSRTDQVNTLLKTMARLLSATNRGAHDVLNSFRIEYLSETLGVRLFRNWYLSRKLFYAWLVSAGAASGIAAAVCNYAT